MEKRRKSAALEKLLKYDVQISNTLVSTLLKNQVFKSFKANGQFLEYSCNGIVWLVCWMGFFYAFGSKENYGMQINMMIGLIFDIIIIALIKAAVRRRRPAEVTDTLTLGPDKFSFPSGHASRSVMILLFFTLIYPSHAIFWPPLFAWATSVCVSRLIMRRHYLLDVICGILLGVVEGLLLSWMALSNESAIKLIKMISDDLPGDDT